MKDNFKLLDKRFPELRREYSYGKLNKKDLMRNPFDQFAKWFKRAVRHPSPRANTMIFTTSTRSGKPSARAVLVKSIDERGFVFYTNYQSQKGRELAANSQASAVFYWPELERQVIITGRVTKIAKKESNAYFQSRARFAKIAAWASDQTRSIRNRAAMQKKLRVFEERFREKEIPLPPHWGGYRLKAQSFEFWQGRKNRFNDRLRYRLQSGKWRVERLQP